MHRVVCDIAPILYGIQAATAKRMTRHTSEPSTRYEEIVRRTVVDPDSSVRPTREQIQAAREGFRAVDADEQALHDRVGGAIAALGVAGVTIEVSRELVTLRGRVADTDMLRALEDAVARVPGVNTVHNQIVVGSP
jgi:hypothetical protein